MMKRSGLFIGIALALLFIGTALAQFNRSMMLGAGVGAGAGPTIRVSPLAPAGTAYYLSGINTAVIAKNQLATSGGVQYMCYYNTANPPAPKFALRNLSSNAVTFVDPGLPAQGLTPTDDEHGDCSIAIDNSGFMHVSYGQHGSGVGLNYYKSNNAVTTTTVGGPFTKLSMVAGNGTIESSVTYPFFIKNPTTGELYFSFRYLGSGDGDQYFYHYTTGTTTWSSAAGTGAGGLMINDTANTTVTSPYLNGLPKWDAAGKLWFNWQEWDAVAGAGHNQYLVAWTGTAFQDMTGAVVTMPIVTQSFAPAVTILAAANANPQNDFTLNKGVFYIPYLRQDSGGIYQVYVAESNSGAFLEHQLTSNTSNPPSGCGTPATMPCAAITGPTAVGNSDGSVYVVYPDLFSTPPGQGVVAAKSTNSFASFTNQVLFSTYTPNFALNLDPTRIGSIASFMRMDSEDYQFGYYASSTPAYTFGNQGSMAIYDWTLAYTPGTPPNLSGGGGGGGGGIPAPALAAGFTTNVYKIDFTTVASDWPAHNVRGCGAPASTPNQPSTWTWTYYSGDNFFMMPCSDTVMVTDPVYGNQALAVEIQPAEYTHTICLNGNASQGPCSGTGFTIPAGVTGGPNNSNWLPHEVYMKGTMRVDNASWQMSNGVQAEYDWWKTTAVFPYVNGLPAWVDNDGAEAWFINGSPIPNALHNQWGNFSGGDSTSVALDLRQYHTIESLVTSDETNVMSLCFWVDGVFYPSGFGKCSQGTDYGADPSVFTRHDEQHYNSIGNKGPVNAGITVPIIIYYKLEELWECPNFTSTTCPISTPGLALVTNWCGDSTTGHACP